MRKDLGIALEEARSNGVHLPVTALVDSFILKYRRWEADAGIPQVCWCDWKTADQNNLKR